MSPLGESDRPAEDEWWRELYGDPPPDPDSAAKIRPDSLDQHFATALTAAGGPEPSGPGPGPGPARDLPPDEPPPRVPQPREQTRPEPPDRDARLSFDKPPQQPPPVPLPDPPGPPPPAPPAQRRAPTPAPVPALPPGWAPVGRAQATPPPAASPPPARPRQPAVWPAGWPAADPERLADGVPDTVLDGARYGRVTLRTAAVRGDRARYRGAPRGEALLTARFGEGDDALLFVAIAGGPPDTPGGHDVARQACEVIGGSVGLNAGRLSDDIRAGRHAAVKAGMQRLIARAYGAMCGHLGGAEAVAGAYLHGLLLPVDPGCGSRVFFGSGPGGLFRLRENGWRDVDGREVGSSGPWFRACDAQPGDMFLLCGPGLCAPLREVPRVSSHLAQRWAPPATVPELPAFLADTMVRIQGYEDDRCAAGLWEDAEE